MVQQNGKCEVPKVIRAVRRRAKLYILRKVVRLEDVLQEAEAVAGLIGFIVNWNTFAHAFVLYII